MTNNSWSEIQENLEIGSLAYGYVESHLPFGVFVVLDNIDFKGLIQITDFGCLEGKMSMDKYPSIGSRVACSVLGFKETGYQIWLKFEKII